VPEQLDDRSGIELAKRFHLALDSLLKLTGEVNFDRCGKTAEGTSMHCTLCANSYRRSDDYVRWEKRRQYSGIGEINPVGHSRPLLVHADKLFDGGFGLDMEYTSSGNPSTFQEVNSFFNDASSAARSRPGSPAASYGCVGGLGRARVVAST